MIENISWMFDGIGTEIFILVVTAIVGGTAIYRFVKNRRWIQEQKAGNYSNQRQEMEKKKKKCKVKNNMKMKTTFIQKQKAGDHSSQVQMGSFRKE